MPEQRETDRWATHGPDHPPRADTPEYRATRDWLLHDTLIRCYVCDGPVDLSHPEAAGITQPEDHHGNGLYLRTAGARPVLVGLALAPLEWSGGWGADPARVQAFATLQHDVELRLADNPYDLGPPPLIRTTAEVMRWVDSPAVANVPLCHVHHVATTTRDTPDTNGHQAVGIHHVPFPVWGLQATWDWARLDLWAGTTGTVAVAPVYDRQRTVVIHAEAGNDHGVRMGDILPGRHALSIAAYRR